MMIGKRLLGNGKQLFTLTLALMMTLSLCACGTKAEPDENSGLYEGVSAKAFGMEMALDEIFDEDISIELKDGGKAVFSYEGKNYNMQWTRSGTTFGAKGGGAELSGTVKDGVLELNDILDSGVDIRMECKSLVRKAARAEKKAAKDGSGTDEPENGGNGIGTDEPEDGGNGIGTDPDEKGLPAPQATGTDFAGDWEGMTFIREASGSHQGLEVAGDWIFMTYARILIDESGDAKMDMVGVMRNKPLNYTITAAGYNAGSNRLGVDGMVAGGTFHAILDAPGANGVLKLEGRTSGDIEASYVCYLKRLDSRWERSDASQIPDREYVMYVENNMPLDKGLTIEERVAAAAEAGIVVDMSGFLPAASGTTAQASGTGAGETGGYGRCG